MSYRVLVCGSRHYKDRDEINRVLDAYHARHGKMLLITGGAVGADELARQWAVSRKVSHLVMYADWERDGRAAGPIRNNRMLKQKPRVVLAFRVDMRGENRGTDHMCSIAEGAEVKVKRFQ